MKNFTDYRIAQMLLPRFGKKNLETLIDQEFEEIHEELSPAETAFYLEKLAKNSNIFEEIKKQNLENVFTLEQEIATILLEMEITGVAFDEEKLKNIWKKIREEIDILEDKIFAIIWERININSPKQLQVFFFEKLGIKPIKKTKTGFSVDNDVLVEIAKTHEVAKFILEYRTLSKLASTYVDGLLKAVDLRDNRIHTRYDSMGAITGRMSSNDPNLQNIPTGDGYASDIKSCFIPTKGNVLIVADYSQIELRILAFLSQDPGLVDAFIHNEDIHQRTAKFLFWDKEISSHERRIAKSVNFGVIYGITGFGLAKTLECSPWEATNYINAFYEKYPGVRKYYDELLEEARKNNFVETFFGRKRFVPGVNDANKTMRQIAEREAMNMPIQWTAADILKLAMIEIAKTIKEKNLQGKMILQVHDELVFDVPENETEIFAKIIPEIMESILEKQSLVKIPENIKIPPLIADIGIWKNWNEAK